MKEDGLENVPEVSPNGVSFVSGNCFDIDKETAEKLCRYDRIYVGAGCPWNRRDFFFSLLAEGGIMIAPIHDSNMLIKVHKQAPGVFNTTNLSSVHFTPIVLPTESEGAPAPKVKLPAVVWAPHEKRHKQFSCSFKAGVRTLLLVAQKKQSPPFLPTHMWLHIVSFTSRDWFLPALTVEQQLRADLAAERALRVQAEETMEAAAKARRLAQAEMNVCQIILRRVRNIVQSPHQQPQLDHSAAITAIANLLGVGLVNGLQDMAHEPGEGLDDDDGDVDDDVDDDQMPLQDNYEGGDEDIEEEEEEEEEEVEVEEEDAESVNHNISYDTHDDSADDSDVDTDDEGEWSEIQSSNQVNVSIIIAAHVDAMDEDSSVETFAPPTSLLVGSPHTPLITTSSSEQMSLETVVEVA